MKSFWADAAGPDAAFFEAHGVFKLGLGISLEADFEGQILCIERVDTRSGAVFGVSAAVPH